MKENDTVATIKKPAEQAPRLRVDSSGLSEATRRELGLEGIEDTDERRVADRERELPRPLRDGQRAEAADANGAKRMAAGGIFSSTAAGVDIGNPLPSGPFPSEASRASRHDGPERTENSDVGKLHISPTREVEVEARGQNEITPLPISKRQSVEGDPVGPLPGGEKLKDAGDEAGESPLAGREDHGWSQRVEPNNRVGPRRDEADPSSGNELFGEGYHPTRADDSELQRPGRARSGSGAGEPPQSEPEGEVPGGRLEAERWRELQAAVKENVAHSQQMHAAVLLALRDSARLHTAQRGELERLAAQVRALLGQNGNAGFNRQ